MGTITAQTILDKFARVLQDETHVRWTETEFLGWLSSAQRSIVAARPDALSETAVLALVAGTKQTLSAGAIALLDVVRNMGSDGNTPGRAITSLAREILDVSIPEWHSASASTTAKHFCFDNRSPKVFYVYPPQPAGTTQQVEIVQSKSPAEVAALTDPIDLDDLYENVLLNYCLHRAYSKDTSHTYSAERAAYHQKLYMEELGLKTQVDALFAPKMNYDDTDKTSRGQ